jgi:hypothetical protein
VKVEPTPLVAELSRQLSLEMAESERERGLKRIQSLYQDLREGDQEPPELEDVR